jgi:hypothetical protein
VLLFFVIAEDVVRIGRLTGILVLYMVMCVTPSDVTELLPYFPYLQRAHMDLGKRLSPFARNHTLMLGDAGAVPYYSNWVSYDFLGLCTSSVAKNGMTEDFLRTIHPDLILVYSSHPGPTVETLKGDSQELVVQYARESGDYDYAGESRWQNFYLVEFLRKDTPDREAILRALHENTVLSSQTSFSTRKLFLQEYVPWSQ